MVCFTVSLIINNVIASPLLLLESFRCYSVQTARMSYVVSLQILRVKVVLDDVAISVSILSLVLERVPKLYHVFVIHLVRN